jgi:hypothetical protein
MALLGSLGLVIASDRVQSIVLAGHDRGVRICHQRLVDADSYLLNFNVRGTIVLDIVPTLVQWQSFDDSKASAGRFH